MSTDKQQPIHRIRYGAISASIWQQETTDQSRIFFNWTLQRSYRDDEGQWHNSESFNVSDCFDVIMAVFGLFRWVRTEGKRRSQDYSQTEDVGEEAADIPF